MTLPWRTYPSGFCNAPDKKDPRRLCQQPAVNNMYWCADHQYNCGALIEQYKGRRACGTRETNPDFRETRCSTLNYNIDSMTLDELNKVKPDLEQRKNRVSQCVDRRNEFERQCIHPSRNDQRHANVLVDLRDENLLCQDMLVRLLARLDHLEKELWVQADLASTAHERGKAQRIAAAANMKALDKEVRELARTVDKLNLQKRQVGDFVGTFAGPSSSMSDAVSSQIAELRKPTITSKKKRNKKGKSPAVGSPSNDFKGKQHREESRRRRANVLALVVVGQRESDGVTATTGATGTGVMGATTAGTTVTGVLLVLAVPVPVPVPVLAVLVETGQYYEQQHVN